MSRRVYSEINLHITWHTKNNQPLITSQIEQPLYKFLTDKIHKTPETFFHAIGVVSDHLHIAVSIPPTLQIADWIGQLKGASSHFINKEIANRKHLEWQNGYGIVSFGTKDLKWVVHYVENQKKHHKENKTFIRLEKIEYES
ncbi:MAG: IS200/IS605 family transposase [Pyrinomonadaceae bacterium]|nr:IS200/IS605 family transposase [Pyrinomonadaceae bacterium]